MKRRNIYAFLTLLGALLFGGLAYGQGVTSSAIRGEILDEKNQPVAGATVKAVHKPTGSLFGSITNEKGQYFIANLRVGGPYELTITADGYKEYREEGIYLQLGQVASISPQLKDNTAQLETVTVTADVDPILNSDKTGTSANFGKETIVNMPVLNRSFRDISRITPQSSSGGFNFAGRSSLYNNFQLDGAVYNNVFGLDALPGGQASADPVSIDAIEEIQVNIAPFDVRQGAFTGASVNAVTRGGTNEFSGSVYYFTQSNRFVGTRVQGNDVTQLKFDQQQYGARIGGPIIKDKLFFFVSAEWTRRWDPFSALRAALPGEVGNSANNISNVSQVAMDQLRANLIGVFGFDPGAYQGYTFATYNDKIFARLDWNISQNHKLTIRHNYVYGYADRTISGTDATYAGGRIGLNALAFESANYNIRPIVNSTVLELRSTFGSRFANNFNITWTNDQTVRGFNGSRPFPSVEVFNVNGAGSNTKAVFGSDPFTPGNILFQSYFTLTNNFNYFVGKHNLTFGTQNYFFSFFNQFLANFWGNYGFLSPVAFFGGATTTAGNPNIPLTTLPQPYTSAPNGTFWTGTALNPNPTQYILQYPQPGAGPSPSASFAAAQLGFYVQDEFSWLNDRMKIQAGLRVDVPIFNVNIPTNNDLVNPNINFSAPYTAGDGATFVNRLNGATTSKLPNTSYLLSPRVGFNWDVMGDRKVQLRGGSGIFTGLVPFVWISNNVTNTGLLLAEIRSQSTTNPIAGAFFNPTVPQPTTGLPASINPPVPAGFSYQAGLINVVDPNFKMPQIWRTNLGVDYKLPGLPLVATLELSYAKDINAMYYRNVNLPDPGRTIPVDGRPAYIPNQGSNARISPGFTNVMLLTNTSQGESWFMTLQLQTTQTKNWNAMAAYNFAGSRDIFSQESSIALSTWTSATRSGDYNAPALTNSNNLQQHRFVASAGYRIEYLKYLGTGVSLFWESRSGGNYSFTYQGSLAQTGALNNGDLMYIPNSAAEINIPANVTVNGNVYTPAQQYAILDAFISQDPYLSRRRGTIAERNAAFLPWYTRVDLRLTQDFFVNVKGKRNTIQLTWDIFNLLNLISPHWGLSYSTITTSPVAVSYTGAITPASVPNFAVNPLISAIAGTSTDRVDPSQAASFAPSAGLASRWQMQFGVRYIFN